MIDMMRPYAPVSADELARAATELRKREHPIPASYRLFLTTCDGGIPDRRCITMADGGESVIKFLYGVGGIDTPESACVTRNLVHTPRRVFPIASDPFGGEWAIDLRAGGDDGPVVFLDWDEIPEDVTDDTPLPVVADSLEAFATLLYACDPDELASPPPKVERGLRRWFRR